MSDLKYWIAFSSLTAGGSATMLLLYNHFGSMKEAWLSSSADIVEIQGITPNMVNKITTEKAGLDPDMLLEKVISKNIKVITFQDEDYPFLLKQIYNPPAILYVTGDLELCNLNKTLAVVGSRRSSMYIREILPKIIAGLRGSDITIVSGLAAGVDSCAHQAALDNNLKTIGVIGSGLDYIYPSQNKTLYKKIAEGNGAVISEYFPEEEAATWKFPARNRIISGLSYGTLIAEAGLRSGALITARLTLEQNRELMCIPGLITNPNTQGIYELMKTGAAVVTKADDILACLKWSREAGNEGNETKNKIHLLDNERKIYEILNLEPLGFDEIIKQSGMNAQELMVVLTSLELNGIIKQLPGQRYMKSDF